MTPYEILFQRWAYEEAIKENQREGGLLFPILRAVRMPDKPVIRALRIKSSRPPHFTCYACLAREAIVRRYNGVWFSVDEQELEAEGLVEVQLVRLPAIIKGDELLDVEGEVTSFSISIDYDLEMLERFFVGVDAIYVNNKVNLKVNRPIF